MFVYHFVDPDLRVEIIFRKDRTVENGEIDFEIVYIAVFLTDVGIYRIADLKSKIIVSHRHFFVDVIFSASSKVSNCQNKSLRKIPIPKQIRTYDIFQGILKTFSNIYALLFIFRKL